jgi:hypothetical protein
MAISTSATGFVHHVRPGRNLGDRTRDVGSRKTGMDITYREIATYRDIAEIVELVERKLAWFGLPSVTIGPSVKVNQRALLIDLLTQGDLLCRIEVDRLSGAITRAGGEVLTLLIGSLRREGKLREVARAG